jgi:antitoxin (DNA-binding transcriptional repressor) of toxin-antitoxin stability system
MEIQLRQFQIHSLELIEKIQQTGEEITLTESGRAIAKIIPLQSQPFLPFIGSMQGSVEVKGDIINPIDETWEAEA